MHLTVKPISNQELYVLRAYAFPREDTLVVDCLLAHENYCNIICAPVQEIRDLVERSANRKMVLDQLLDRIADLESSMFAVRIAICIPLSQKGIIRTSIALLFQLLLDRLLAKVCFIGYGLLSMAISKVDHAFLLILLLLLYMVSYCSITAPYPLEVADYLDIKRYSLFIAYDLFAASSSL